MKRVLLVIKAEGRNQSLTAIAEVKKRLGDIVANNTILSDNTWKVRQTGDVVLIITIHSASSMEIIYNWFGEDDHHAPFPEGSLLFFKDMS